MDVQLDLILHQLSDDRSSVHRFSTIAEAFQRAGYRSPAIFLQHLSDEGYIERLYGKDALYRLTDKGRHFYRSGGFLRKAIIKRERRIASVLTVIAILLLCLVAAIINNLGKSGNNI